MEIKIILRKLKIDFEFNIQEKRSFRSNFVFNSFFQNPFDSKYNNFFIDSYQDAHAFVSSGNGVTFLTDLDGDSDSRLEAILERRVMHSRLASI